MVILALMVQRHELNLFRKPISGRYVAVAFHKHVFVAYLFTTFIRLYDAQRSSMGGRRVGRHYTRSGLAMWTKVEPRYDSRPVSTYPSRWYNAMFSTMSALVYKRRRE